MNLRTKRKMAASILKVGLNRVWIDHEKMSEVSEALTKNDVRRLINSGMIKAKQKKGTSSYHSKKLREQKKKGRRRGIGKRKGRKLARSPRKKEWVKGIRAIRKELLNLKKKDKITVRQYRKLYNLANGGIFRNKAYLHLYIKKMRK